MTTILSNEPVQAVIAVLKARLTDYNSAARQGPQWIYDDLPNVKLKSSEFPRISVFDVTETAEIVDIGRTMKYFPRIQIDVWIWNGIDGTGKQILAVSGVNYSGSKLRALISRDIINALDDNKSDFDDDTNILHNYKLLANVPMGPDPERKQLIRKRIEIGFEYFRG